MLDHRHPRFGQQARDQPLAATRDDDVDVLAQGDQVADGGAVGGIDHLHRMNRQTGGFQTVLHQTGNHPVAANRFRTTAQDRRIARFQAQCRCVGGNVRSGFVDDANNAQWHTHLADLDTTRAILDFADFAHRIGQGGNLFDAIGHLRDAFFRETQAIEHRRLQPGCAGRSQIVLICIKN